MTLKSLFGFKKPDTATDADGESGMFARLGDALKRTRGGLTGWLRGLRADDADLLETLEARLLSADVGVEVTQAVLANIGARLGQRELSDAAALSGALRAELLAILQPCNRPLVIARDSGPFVLLMVGVNGAGKTTTIGKLARQLQRDGRSVMLAAGDTFRAAAVEQLQVWGERNQVPVIAAQHAGADSAAVRFDAVQAARARAGWRC